MGGVHFIGCNDQSGRVWLIMYSGKFLWVQILAEMQADAWKKFWWYLFYWCAVTKRKLHLLTDKLVIFILAVYKPSARTAKICALLKFPAMYMVAAIILKIMVNKRHLCISSAIYRIKEAGV